MAFAASVIRTVSGLEVEVMHAYARIVEGTDPEALHDLRVAARRLRSLLKPLRLGALAEDLDRAAKALGQATNPIRDMEVMAAELERHGLLIPASLRRQAVLRWYRQAGSSPQIKDLLDALDAWPDGVRRAMTEGRLDDLEAEASKRIRHQLRKLLAALDDPGHDLHDIRLLVKRARYSQEAYPDLCPLPGKVLDTLKTLQTMLGDWHDHQQWCLRADEQADLRPLSAEWRRSEAAALDRADESVRRLARLLGKAIGRT
ncbi:CHAD domain-containing protein [Pseudomonas aeruginosa]|uniref:CHAD domain-containing protein n=1 Tax=Pseudomonas TaxID=286 RepID=UPI00044FB5C4|nr:CHAD domain-containing protein [Pseudomonas aeruginosa]EVT84499.1 hypothetical protein Z046_06450 [Pseudomonas aeruginosa VRFPA09]AWF58025.1 CHAD domain protein [Pseudomonas aeruginosa]AWF63468.1 CHAD domain protein [Pseudomonas aeruginosa]AYQ83032.1 CHAD domain-containing protein [Pseudomonas aeruginosa]AYR15029.1 CHAD domain-containing protein [Pseudomonas aeruginosa]